MLKNKGQYRGFKHHTNQRRKSSQMDYDKGIVKKVKNYKKIQVVYKEIQIEETANNFFI